MLSNLQMSNQREPIGSINCLGSHYSLGSKPFQWRPQRSQTHTVVDTNFTCDFSSAHDCILSLSRQLILGAWAATGPMMMMMMIREGGRKGRGWNFLHLFLQYLLAVDALLGKLLLIARQAEIVALLLHKAAGADGLLAALAAEAMLMPAVALVLHLL